MQWKWLWIQGRSRRLPLLITCAYGYRYIRRHTLRGSSVFPIGFFFIALAMRRCMEAADTAASATHTHTHTHTHIQTHTYTRTHTYTYIHIHTHTHGVSRVFSLYWKYTWTYKKTVSYWCSSG